MGVKKRVHVSFWAGFLSLCEDPWLEVPRFLAGMPDGALLENP